MVPQICKNTETAESPDNLREENPENCQKRPEYPKNSQKNGRGENQQRKKTYENKYKYQYHSSLRVGRLWCDFGFKIFFSPLPSLYLSLQDKQ